MAPACSRPIRDAGVLVLKCLYLLVLEQALRDISGLLHLPIDSSGKPAQGVQDASLFLRCHHLSSKLAEKLLKSCARLVSQVLQSLHLV